VAPFLENLESQRSEIMSQINEAELDEEKEKYFESLANLESLGKITTPKKRSIHQNSTLQCSGCTTPR
jgi:hypothetical protein